MATNPQQGRFSFSFTAPTERVLEIANTFLKSPDEKRRAVAKALLDVTREAQKVQRGLQSPGTVDVAPYLDFWMADAIAAAHELLTSDDKDARAIAKCLLDQESNIINSKKTLLSEAKRLKR